MLENPRGKTPGRVRLGALVASAVALALTAGTPAANAAFGPVAPGPTYLLPASTAPSALYLDRTSQLATSAAQDPRLSVLARTPTARWLTESSAGAGGIASLRGYLRAASAAHRAPQLVLYNIPERDCGGGASTGGLPVKAYVPWVRKVADVLRGHRKALVILEPDALAHSISCSLHYDRLRMLDRAAGILGASGAQVYLDAGNASWLPAGTAARLLAKAGVRHVTGFSLNVSSFVPTQQTITYADTVIRDLRTRGIRGAHYVIDTSRNGGQVTPGDWCNPVGARIGDQPQLFSGGPLDAFLWVKPPGESDGYCNGGPAAGTFSTELALRLLGEA